MPSLPEPGGRRRTGLPGRHHRHRAALVGAAVLAMAVLLVGATASARAGAFEQISNYDADLTIEPSGGLRVVETITYDFGGSQRHGILRTIPVRVDYPPRPDHDRVYPLDVLSVRASGGASAHYELEGDGNDTTIRIGDPDRMITGSHTYEIAYRVRGALNGFADHDELVWNVVGTEWTVPIRRATATVHAPATILAVNCASGPYGATLPCGASSVLGDAATFSVDTLSAFSGMTVSIAIPTGAVPTPRPILEERFALDRAFSVTGVTAGVAGGLLALVIGIFALLAWRVGRDRRFRGSAVDTAFGTAEGSEERVPLAGEPETPVEFVPPDGLRPGQVGTLVDFEANPLDVTATIVDLAVRGYLTIEELEPSGLFRTGDWQLTKTRDVDELMPYERALADGLFKSRTTVKVSELRNYFASTTRKVRAALIDDALAKGWFAGRPATVRTVWAAAGWVVLAAGVGATVALAALTHAALVGLPLIVAGVLVLIGARWMPRRTAQGYAVLRRAEGFRRFIDESERERARFAERANLFSEYLPYAVVFGATEKWARAFSGLDGVPPDTSSWYVSRLPFDYLVFSGAIESFTVTTAGTLTSVPASSGGSGFSGGGFSGGGGGGGGGGSW